jgi:ubiquinone/menaquinone biosynthesis C-methylase UbiE
MAMKVISRIMRRLQPARQAQPPCYETLCEAHARIAQNEEHAIGDGDFDSIGRTELDLLIEEGLRPTNTLVDLGCGIGRLAVHAIQYLTKGHYVGIEIADTFLVEAERRLRNLTQQSSCRVKWKKQRTDAFDLPDDSVDFLCAFSVFTHLEHEDSHRYLKSALRIVKPGGKFIFSCLPYDLPAAQAIFQDESAMTFDQRWSRIRNVVTTVELMTGIARSAGWEVSRWRRGGEANIRQRDGSFASFGHSSCVLVAPK